MKKCWSPDPFFRPAAKDLDTLFLDMNSRDAEPLTTEEMLEAQRRREKASGDMLYELFPKHVAGKLLVDFEKPELPNRVLQLILFPCCRSTQGRQEGRGRAT